MMHTLHYMYAGLALAATRVFRLSGSASMKKVYKGFGSLECADTIREI